MARKNLQQVTGTIAHCLTSNKDKIWECGSNIHKMRAVVNDLLASEELQGNPEVANAVKILNKSKDNLFLSILMTYMTGMKVSF